MKHDRKLMDYETKQIFIPLPFIPPHFDLCPPLSSERLSFQQSPNATRISNPSNTFIFSGGSNFACVPGRSVENIELKS